MKKAIIVLVIAFAILASVDPAKAQQAGKNHRIGVLSYVLGMNPTYESFRQGLRELGYVEGRNIAIEWRFAQRMPDQLAKMAAELVRLKVDVIVTGGPPAPFAARKATRTIPIVVAVNADYVGQGLVESLRRPGATSPACRPSAPNSSANSFSSSKRPSQGWHWGLSSGTRPIAPTPQW